MLRQGFEQSHLLTHTVQQALSGRVAPARPHRDAPRPGERAGERADRSPGVLLALTGAAFRQGRPIRRPKLALRLDIVNSVLFSIS